jgi:hypothetical protein
LLLEFTDLILQGGDRLGSMGSSKRGGSYQWLRYSDYEFRPLNKAVPGTMVAVSLRRKFHFQRGAFSQPQGIVPAQRQTRA